MSELTDRIKNGIMDGWSANYPCLDGEIAEEAWKELEVQSGTISSQAKIIEDLIEAVRSIALMDEVDAVLDPQWAINRADKAWKEAIRSIYPTKQPR